MMSESYLKSRQRVVMDALPVYAGATLVVALLWPWAYNILGSVVCSHHGVLDMFWLQCDCPAVYADNAGCTQCQVKNGGSCVENSAAEFGYGVGVSRGHQLVGGTVRDMQCQLYQHKPRRHVHTLCGAV